jgi:hypothetical protein
MRRIFWGFCRNRFGIGPFHYISSRSDFGLEFAEIFTTKNQLPDSASRRVDDSPRRGVGESDSRRFSHSWSWGSTTLRLINAGSFLLKIQKPTLSLSDSASRWLPDSPSRRVVDSLTRRVGESPTPRLAESRSCFSFMNIFANSKPKSERLER